MPREERCARCARRGSIKRPGCEARLLAASVAPWKPKYIYIFHVFIMGGGRGGFETPPMLVRPVNKLPHQDAMQIRQGLERGDWADE